MDADRLRPLVEAFVWPMVFFELCDDETLDPDIAVQQMDTITAVLGKLGPVERDLVLQVLDQLAQEAQQPEVRAFIRDLPQAVGLIDESDVGEPSRSQ